jgi:hypothetical protein
MAFTLETERWYAWQMIPGYVGTRCVPYCCPAWINSVSPMKSGKGLLRLAFWNTGYAEGAQDFEVHLKVLLRGENYLVGALVDDPAEKPERCAVISDIEFGWIAKFCPDLWFRNPPSGFGQFAESSVSIYLDKLFNRG